MQTPEVGSPEVGLQRLGPRGGTTEGGDSGERTSSLQRVKAPKSKDSRLRTLESEDSRLRTLESKDSRAWGLQRVKTYKSEDSIE